MLNDILQSMHQCIRKYKGINCAILVVNSGLVWQSTVSTSDKGVQSVTKA